MNDRNDYIDFPNKFVAFACWNVNLSDFPNIPETFEHVIAPLDAGTYYAGAVLYAKPHGGDSRQMKVVPLEKFVVVEGK